MTTPRTICELVRNELTREFPGLQVIHGSAGATFTNLGEHFIMPYREAMGNSMDVLVERIRLVFKDYG